MGSAKKLLHLGLLCILWKCLSGCEPGFKTVNRRCVDVDECNETPNLCGNHSKCFNTNGSYYCNCEPGFKNKGNFNFSAIDGQCQDDNECTNDEMICGYGGKCFNLIGSYNCTCNPGYTNNGNIRGVCNDDNECTNDEMICGYGGKCFNLNGSYNCACNPGYTNNGNIRGVCNDINECSDANVTGEDLCKEGTCENIDGGYWCRCQKGYTNYGNERTPCSKLDCDNFSVDSKNTPSLQGLADILFMMRNSCLALSNPSVDGEVKPEGEALLEKLFTATEVVLSPGYLDSSEDVSRLLSTVEKAIMLIGPQLKDNNTKLETSETDAVIAVQRGKTPPTGPIHLSSENAALDTDWTTAAGTGSYPGFALAALLSYKNLEISVNGSFEELRGYAKDDVQPTFNVSSGVVSVVVSNPSTQSLSHHVNITLRHLQNKKESHEVRYICVYWTERGTWSSNGCDTHHPNTTHTVCKCDHLSSFAVLMALYPMEHPFELVLMTKIGLGFSLLCLILCILTFKFCRSIQGTRTTIHLHLCICLFIADLFFLTGISQTEPEGGCRFIAAMLHFFFLGVFSWMLLEGVQLYCMVVRVFNATIRPLYLFITGYGAPLVIVIISAIIRPKGYGTKKHCWLSVEDGLIWSFFGPVCFVIIANVFFFIITVWKLAQKFASLNPDLSKLHKIKAFTVTAIAQMCILGLMWVFGAFLFQEFSIVVAYIFTFLNSLQGVLVFIMHCLLSKQVRDEYAHFLSCICTPRKKRYSDFSSTNPSSSQSQASRSGQHTGESKI